MNLIDLFIIYLACGAPFGVYYFLQNRSYPNSSLFWFKTLFNFFFWMPFAFQLLRRYKNIKTFSISRFAKTSAADSMQAEHFRSIQKQIEKILLKSNLQISIYELREILERYVGLTLAEQNNGETSAEEEKEIFRVVQMKNIELGSICLRRRNRKRLSLHQTEARKDFLYLINQLNEFEAEKDNLRQSAIEFVQILKDLEAEKELERMFTVSPQIDNRQNVQKLEKDLWKPEIHRPLPARQISSHFQAMKATLNSRRKD
jgi:predicted nucleotidyltransferase